MASAKSNHVHAARASMRGKGKRSKKTSVIQPTLGWSLLALVAWAILRNGGVAPLIWHLLTILTLVFFVIQVGLDLRYGLNRTARTALVPAVPFFLALAWMLAQSVPGLLPAFAHPVWTIAPQGARPAISAHPDAAWPLVMRFTCYAMVFWVLLRSASTAGNGAIRYIQAVAVFSTALAVYGIISKVTGYNVLFGTTEPTSAVRASLWNRNSYATVAVFGVLANISAYVNAVSGSVHREGLFALRDFLETFFSSAWIFAFGALVGLGALAMTLSRGGAIAGAVGVLVLVWALRRGSGKAGTGALAIPVALFGFVVLFMSSGVVARLDVDNVEGRPDVYRQIVVGIQDRPLLGHGAGAFPEAFRPYAPASQAQWDWSKAHNTYLETAFEFGLPAAAAFFLALGMIGWRLLTGVRTRRRHQGTPAFALACFAAAAVHSLVDFSLQIPAVAALFAAILGIGWGQAFPSRQPAAARTSQRRKVDG